MGKTTTPARPGFNKAVIWLMRLLGIGAILIAVIFLLTLGIPYIKDAHSYTWVRTILNIERSLTPFIQEVVPTRIVGYDVTKWIIIVTAIILRGIFSLIEDIFSNKMGKKTTSAQAGFYGQVIWLMRLLGIGAILIAVIFLLTLGIPYIKDAHSYTWVRTILNIERSLTPFIQEVVPTRIAGYDVTKWIIIVTAIILRGIFGRIEGIFRSRLDELKVKKSYEAFKEEMHLSDDSKVLAPIKEKMETLHAGDRKGRGELLELLAETKKKLESMGRELAFLSIDVIGSTEMKVNEEKTSVEYDFRGYKKFVESQMKANGALKSAWTPDGVMICFPSVDAAVRTAQDVINGLDAFNKNVKTIKADFRVRCGVNSGYVYYDEATPMEEMSDRVIDVAGHMQKYAAPNTIAIAKPSIEPLRVREGFKPASKVVNGYDVYQWEKNSEGQTT